jgi:hypothetical protein
MRRDPTEYTFTPVDLSPELHLKRGEGEELDEYRVRAKEAVKEFAADLDGSGVRGPVPTDTAAIERNVDWFYDCTVRDVPKIQLAADWFTDQYADVEPEQQREMVSSRRKDVRDGIRAAERLLGSSGVAFSLPPAGS